MFKINIALTSQTEEIVKIIARNLDSQEHSVGCYCGYCMGVSYEDTLSTDIINAAHEAAKKAALDVIIEAASNMTIPQIKGDMEVTNAQFDTLITNNNVLSGPIGGQDKDDPECVCGDDNCIVHNTYVDDIFG